MTFFDTCYRINMKNITKKYIYRFFSLVLMLLWMIIVFSFSNQSAQNSDETSMGVTVKILNIFIKDETQRQDLILKYNPIVRKIAHFTLYTVGGILILNFINTFELIDEKKMFFSICIGIMYSASDEIHQLFVDGRGGQITDVILDTLGVATGVCIFLCIIKLVRGKRSENNKKI